MELLGGRADNANRTERRNKRSIETLDDDVIEAKKRGRFIEFTKYRAVNGDPKTHGHKIFKGMKDPVTKKIALSFSCQTTTSRDSRALLYQRGRRAIVHRSLTIALLNARMPSRRPMPPLCRRPRPRIRT